MKWGVEGGDAPWTGCGAGTNFLTSLCLSVLMCEMRIPTVFMPQGCLSKGARATTQDT